MNIFERATQLAQSGRSTEDIIKTLKAERYEQVVEHLSPSVRRHLKAVREAARVPS